MAWSVSLVFIALCIVVLSCVLSVRIIDKVDKKAKQIFREKFGKRREISVDWVIDRCNIPEQYAQNAAAILNGMATILQSGTNRLSPYDSLGKLIQVESAELPKEYGKLRKFSEYDKQIWVFQDELVHFFQEHVNDKRWTDPDDDEELCNLLMTAPLCEVLHTFAPIFVADGSGAV